MLRVPSAFPFKGTPRAPGGKPNPLQGGLKLGETAARCPSTDCHLNQNTPDQNRVRPNTADRSVKWLAVIFASFTRENSDQGRNCLYSKRIVHSNTEGYHLYNISPSILFSSEIRFFSFRIWTQKVLPASFFFYWTILGLPFQEFVFGCKKYHKVHPSVLLPMKLHPQWIWVSINLDVFCTRILHCVPYKWHFQLFW